MRTPSRGGDPSSRPRVSRQPSRYGSCYSRYLWLSRCDRWTHTGTEKGDLSRPLTSATESQNAREWKVLIP
jgi:hypothetical protein